MTERIGKSGPRAGQPSTMRAAGGPIDQESQPSRCEADRPLRILVADDTRSYREMVKAILSRRGHRIELVRNGRQAVDRQRQADFDVVLVDVHMPTMDGLEAAEAIRRNTDERRKAVPIIAMTAHAVESDRETCLAAGVDDYLLKPFDAAELIRVIELHGGRQDAIPAEREKKEGLLGNG